MEKIKYELKNISTRSVIESDVNAQVMSDSDFKRLVKNIKKDGTLTSAVLVMRQSDSDKFMCISGHHRIRAAIKADLKTIPALIIDEVCESTRTRLQLTHNDIHGNPDLGIVSILQKRLNSNDIELVDVTNADALNVENIEIGDLCTFQYVSICMKPESYEEFMDLLGSHDVDEEAKFIIDAKDYKDLKDALTLAFKSGFKTPGKAFRKFMEIVNNHKDEML